MVVMPDADLEQAVDALIGAAYGSAGERCMAISRGGAGRRRRRPDRAAARRARDDAEGQERHGARRRDGPARHARRRSSASRATSRRASSEGATLVVDGRGSQGAGPRERLLHRRHAVRPRHAGDEDLQGRDLRPGARRACACPTSSRRVELVNEHEFGNGVACFTSDGNVAREFARRVQIGMVGINVPIPVPMAWHGFGGWKRACSATCTPTARKACASTPGRSRSCSAGPRASRKGAEFAMPTAK